MKIPKALNTALIAVTVCGVGGVSVSCNPWRHPFPRHEIYEAKAPDTDCPVVRIRNTRWPGEHTPDVWPAIIRFRQSDGAILSIRLPIENDPNYWSVEYCPPGGESEKIGLTRIYGPSGFPLNFSDKCWVEEGESFAE